MKLLIGLVTSIVLTVSTPTKPELRRIGGTANYVAFNPLKKPIEMKISCLGDFEPIVLPLPARTQERLEIKQPSGYAASCFLDGFVEK